jgi:hypothetical protein
MVRRQRAKGLEHDILALAGRYKGGEYVECSVGKDRAGATLTSAGLQTRTRAPTGDETTASYMQHLLHCPARPDTDEA